MTRGRLAGVLAVLAAAGAAWWWTASRPAFTLTPRTDRNVLVITIDTLRADVLSGYGGAAATPVLDALAARGARFTFAHAHAVLTLPSHTSLLSGRYPYQHGVRDNTGFRVRADERTLATELEAAGFATGAFISAFVLDQRYGLNRGFDHYDDRVAEVGAAMAIGMTERRADATVAAARDWIGRQSGKWFTWVHLFDPHAPYQPPAEWLTRYPANAYAAEAAWTDAALAPLVADLERSPRPTLVVVTADHGESLGEHGELTHGVFAYEATLHVPLIVAEIAPGHAASQGAVIDTPARHVDVMPTVLEAVGVAVPADRAGTSLLPVIAGADRGDRPSYFESMMPTLARGWAPLRGVLSARDKYIDLPIPEAYDLERDPGELQNLAPLDEPRRSVLTSLLKGFDTARPNAPGLEPAAVRERLQALGYTSGSAAPTRDTYTEADDPKRLIELDKRLHRARDAFQAGRVDEALSAYRAVIAERPDTADAYRHMAFIHWESGQAVEAVRTLEAAVKAGVSQIDIQVKLGIYLAELGDTARAIPLLQALPDDDSEALNALGLAFARAGRAREALATFARALQIDPTNALAHQNIGTVHLSAGDLVQAERELRLALDVDPTLPGAHTTLGVLLARTNRRPEAITVWQRAVDLDPTEFFALYNLTIELLRMGRAVEARTYGERFLATAPPSVFGPDLAEIRRLLGR